MRKLIKLATIIICICTVKNASTQTLNTKDISTDSSQLQELSTIVLSERNKNIPTNGSSMVMTDSNNAGPNYASTYIFDTLYFFKNIFLKTPLSKSDSVQMLKALISLKKYMQKKNFSSSSMSNITKSAYIKNHNTTYRRIFYCKRIDLKQPN